MSAYVEKLPRRIARHHIDRCARLDQDGNRCQEDGIYEVELIGLTGSVVIKVCESHVPGNAVDRLKRKHQYGSEGIMQ